MRVKGNINFDFKKRVNTNFYIKNICSLRSDEQHFMLIKHSLLTFTILWMKHIAYRSQNKQLR